VRELARLLVRCCSLASFGCSTKNEFLTCLSFTTGFRAFAESGVPLGEGFTESELSAKASRRLAAGEGLFDERCRSSSRRIFGEMPIWLSVKKIS
jgi:hypothetical protein